VGVRSLSAQANTIRQRNANACDDEWRRAQRCRVLRSSPLSLIGTVGRPRRAIVNSFCQVVYLAEHPHDAKIPDHPKFLH